MKENLRRRWRKGWKKDTPAASLVASSLSSEQETSTCGTSSVKSIPYLVTSPLPPIFSKELCRIYPKIQFLSRSHPDLASIRWCEPDTNYREEAEEALNEQYERNVREF